MWDSVFIFILRTFPWLWFERIEAKVQLIKFDLSIKDSKAGG